MTRRRALVRTLPLALTLAASLASPQVAAQGAATDPVDRQQEARRIFEQATALSDAGRWDQACPMFSAAHALYPTGGTGMNVARCHEEAGRRAEALAAYEAVLALPDQPPERVRVAEERAAALRAALTEPSPPPPSTPPPSAPTPSPSPEEPPPPDEDQGMGYAPSAIAFGVGGAGLVVGAVFGGLALSTMGDVEAACEGNVCPPELEADRDAAVTQSWVSNVGFVVGGLGVAAGVVLAVVAGADPPSSSARVRGTPRGLVVRF